MRLSFSRRPRRGSALALSLIVSVVITGLIGAIAWVAATQSANVGSLDKIDKAFFAAESGTQLVAWYCKSGTMSSITSPLTGTINGCSYSVSWSTVSGSTIRITSVASLGNASYTMAETVTPPSGSSTPAMCAGGNNGNISGNVTVTGDVQTKEALNGGAGLVVTGNLTLGGALNGTPKVGGNLGVNGDCNGAASVSGNMIVTGSLNANPTVSKNLTVDGVINGHPVVGGTTTAHGSATVSVSTPPAVSSMVSTLKATAGETLNHPSSITTIDFTASPNGIIYINGDANLNGTTVVIGSGTIVLSGNWNQSTRFPATGTANVTVVCAGDLNVSSSLNTVGGLYSGGNWNQSGTFSITGPIVIDGDENVSGSGTITTGSSPSFDPRGTGSSSTTFASFTGPQP